MELKNQIRDFLHVNYLDGFHTKDLCGIFGISDGALRDYVAQLREEGEPIVVTKKGYQYNFSEAKHSIESLKRRFRHGFKTVSKWERKLTQNQNYNFLLNN